MIRQDAPTYTATIFIAGDLSLGKQVCREFCMRGLCVTVEPVDFIYTGGEEAGMRIGLINYPRFPSEPEGVFNRAEELADLLRERLCQQSYSIVTPDTTVWSTTRATGVIIHDR